MALGAAINAKTATITTDAADAASRRSMVYKPMHHQRRWWTTFMIGHYFYALLITGQLLGNHLNHCHNHQLWPAPRRLIADQLLINGLQLHFISVTYYNNITNITSIEICLNNTDLNLLVDCNLITNSTSATLSIDSNQHVCWNMPIEIDIKTLNSSTVQHGLTKISILLRIAWKISRRCNIDIGSMGLFTTIDKFIAFCCESETENCHHMQM